MALRSATLQDADLGGRVARRNECHDPAHVHADLETQEVAVELPALVKSAALNVWDDPPDGLGRPRPVGRGNGASLLLQEAHDLRPGALEVSADSLQHARSHAVAFEDQSQQKVLRADIVVLQPARLVQRHLEHLLPPRREWHVSMGIALADADGALDLGAQAVQGNVQTLEGFSPHPLALANEPQKDMLGANRVMPQTLGFFLSQNDRAAGAIREPLEHGDSSLLSAGPTATRVVPAETPGPDG